MPWDIKLLVQRLNLILILLNLETNDRKEQHLVVLDVVEEVAVDVTVEAADLLRETMLQITTPITTKDLIIYQLNHPHQLTLILLNHRMKQNLHLKEETETNNNLVKATEKEVLDTETETNNPVKATEKEVIETETNNLVKATEKEEIETETNNNLVKATEKEVIETETNLVKATEKEVIDPVVVVVEVGVVEVVVVEVVVVEVVVVEAAQEVEVEDQTPVVRINLPHRLLLFHRKLKIHEKNSHKIIKL